MSDGAPNRSRVDYTVRVLESMCVLLGLSAEDDGSLVCIAQQKLAKVWPVEHKSYGDQHQPVQAKVFWDAVITSLDTKRVYSLLAVFGETINPANDARQVELTIGPAHQATQIRIRLTA